MTNIFIQITTKQNCDFLKCDLNEIIQVDFQKYIATVVASEIGNAPLEACKAQAVAARGLALSRGAFNGKIISDSASVIQAYRAARYDNNTYPNAIQGTIKTQGQILVYNGSLAVTHYSANNGGHIISSKERWGGAYPYLIDKLDPWDAATNKEKYGHGVGMSQLGAIFAANQGIGYEEILNFYYPGCTLCDNYNGLKPWSEIRVINQVYLNDKARSVIQLAKNKKGDPYVYGARGEICMPSTRKRYAALCADSHPDYSQKIYQTCPILSNNRIKECIQCHWNGHSCYDCRGFIYYCFLKAANIKIQGAGATSQYNDDDNWLEKGQIENMPNVVCAVFKKKGDKMSHVGIHIGDGAIIHCSTTVKDGSLNDTSWTHYAIPKGLYTQDEIQHAGHVVFMTTIKTGSRGAIVERLQTWLNQLGYHIEADGKFGLLTKTAVQNFQEDENLVVDGIVGAHTWGALQERIYEKEHQKESQIKPVQNINLNMSLQLAKQLYEILKKKFEGRI